MCFLFVCAQDTDDDIPSLIRCGRLVLADARLLLLVLFSAAILQAALCLFSLFNFFW